MILLQSQYVSEYHDRRTVLISPLTKRAYWVINGYTLADCSYSAAYFKSKRVQGKYFQIPLMYFGPKVADSIEEQFEVKLDLEFLDD
jgi:hypothetical protein